MGVSFELARLSGSVSPPAAQSSTWCVWQASAGIPHPGMMQPRSRVARARRWAGVALRAERPTASGIRVPSRVVARAVIRAVAEGWRVTPSLSSPAGSMAARNSATVSGHCPASTTIGVIRASHALKRCSAAVRVCPRDVVHTRSPRDVDSRVTETETGSPPRVGIDPLACAELTRATSPSARRAEAGT